MSKIMTLKCGLTRQHSMKHYLITTVEEFDDDRGGPASRLNKVINRKCMRKGCDHKETELIQS